MYEMQRVVTSSDCDQNGIQSVVSVVTMMQDCSGLWIESEPVVFDWLQREHLALVITSRQLDIYRRPLYRERLRVRTQVYQLKGPLGYRNTMLLDEQAPQRHRLLPPREQRPVRAHGLRHPARGL